MPDYSSERTDSIFRQVSSMSAEDLSGLLTHLGNVERAAVVQLRGEGTLSVGVTDQVGITDAISVTLTGPSVATGTGAGHFVFTVSASGYAPPVAPTEAVARLWDSIKPKNTEEALAISRELRRWVLIILLVVGAGTSTPGLLAALEDAFRASVGTVQKEATADPATE